MAPGKVLAAFSLLIGLLAAVFYFAMTWIEGEEPYSFFYMMLGTFGSWMMALGFYWGMARESWNDFWTAVTDRIGGGDG